MKPQKLKDYLDIFKKETHHNDRYFHDKALSEFVKKYPVTDTSKHHRPEEQIRTAAIKKRLGKPSKNPEVADLYKGDYKDAKPVRNIRSWHPSLPIPAGYQTLDSKTYYHIKTGDILYVTYETPKRSLYREYMMTHHSKRAAKYPNGPPPDDRHPLLPKNDPPEGSDAA